MAQSAIEAYHLGKRYQIGDRAHYRTFREAIADQFSLKARNAKKNFVWALRNIEFKVARGEVVGIIGANGSGKSTLLKLFSRITEPTEGWAKMNGRIGSLLEVGTGFHSELTGRENIFLSGVILGMRRSEIKRKFDQIVSFSGIERFVDTPVKHYSSGMYVRLAFSVAAHLDTEILLVDEVLAVGDVAFQLKCFIKMSEIMNNGKTILFVSHNLEAVSKLCKSSILLEGGEIAKLGPTDGCIDYYLRELKRNNCLQQTTISLKEHSGRTKNYDGLIRFTGMQIIQSAQSSPWTVYAGDSLTLQLRFDVKSELHLSEAMFIIIFSNMNEHRISSCRSSDVLEGDISFKGSGEISCDITSCLLRPGIYKISLGCQVSSGYSDFIYDAAFIEVLPSNFYKSGDFPPSSFGEALLYHQWKVLSHEQR